MSILGAVLLGLVGWFLVRYLVFGFFTVNQNERAVKTVFGRAQRLSEPLPPPSDAGMSAEEAERYRWPQMKVLPPGGPYFRLPWEKVYKVSVATQTLNMAFDPENPGANRNGTQLEAVTKDQLITGLTGQIRYRVSESMLYPYLFGVKNPIAHVMGYFISILRERIANFEAPTAPDGSPSTPGLEPTLAVGVSINDLRKNLRDLNERMDHECRSSTYRYGIVLDASLITGIDPPHEVESALAAINTAHNQVSSDISLAQASADQKMVQSKRAVEIETLNAHAEVEPLLALAQELAELKANGGPSALAAYLRNVRLTLLGKADNVILEASR
jgi:regulator of protease activity HflC (stomatin/prohibitin superfamily)